MSARKRNEPELSLNDGLPPTSEGEANNAVYLVLKYGFSWPMRAADWGVVKMLAESRAKAAHRERATLDEYVNTAIEYGWDHIAGHRNEPPKKLYKQAHVMLSKWIAATTPEERAKTE